MKPTNNSSDRNPIFENLVWSVTENEKKFGLKLTKAPIIKKSSRYRPVPLSFREMTRNPTATVERMKAKQVDVITT